MAKNSQNDTGDDSSAENALGSTVGVIAGANPISGFVQTGTGLIKGITEAVTAAQQAKRAQELRDQANNLGIEAIRPEFLTALQNSQMQSLYGLPGLQTYQNKIGQNIANSVRAIKEASPNGESTLAAISNTFANANNATNDLSAKDAQSQEAKAQLANQTLWNVGEQYRGLENLRDKQKIALQQQAGNLETASTLNKQTGINDALGGASQGLSQMFQMGEIPTEDKKHKYEEPLTLNPLTGSNAQIPNSNPYGGGNMQLYNNPTPVNDTPYQKSFNTQSPGSYGNYNPYSQYGIY